MPTNSETGHAKNAAGFTTVVADLQSFGLSYNPFAPEIKIASLLNVKTSLNTTMDSVRNSESPYKNAINARQLAFEIMDKYATRIQNALVGCGASKKEIADAMSIKKKIAGTRAKPIKPKPASSTETPTDAATLKVVDLTDPNLTVEQVEQHSVSQLSFDNRTENFKKYVAFLAGITKYNPNEADLKVTALTTWATGLNTLNTNVNDTYIVLYKARELRNKLLYAATTGIHDLFQQIKAYVLSAFGEKNSMEYKLISKIHIKKISN